MQTDIVLKKNQIKPKFKSELVTYLRNGQTRVEQQRTGWFVHRCPGARLSPRVPHCRNGRRHPAQTRERMHGPIQSPDHRRDIRRHGILGETIPIVNKEKMTFPNMFVYIQGFP